MRGLLNRKGKPEEDMTKKNASKTAARARQTAMGGKYEAHLRTVKGVIDAVKSVLTRSVDESQMPRVGEGLVVGPELIVGARMQRLTLEDFAREEAQIMIERHHQVKLVAVFRFKDRKAPHPMPGPKPAMANHWEGDSAGKFARLDVPLTGTVITEGFVEDLDLEQRSLVEARYPSAGVVTWHPVDR